MKMTEGCITPATANSVFTCGSTTTRHHTARLRPFRRTPLQKASTGTCGTIGTQLQSAVAQMFRCQARSACLPVSSKHLTSLPPPHHLLSLAYPFAGEAAGADAEEGGTDVAGHGLADQRLAGARRTEQQDALGWRARALQQRQQRATGWEGTHGDTQVVRQWMAVVIGSRCAWSG